MRTVPLRERSYDLVFLAFFLVNLGFVTYIVDLEQLVIADPNDFEYPLWPPAPLIDLVHRYGNGFDPLLMARPPFWRMTIWIDVLCFGPFYLCAIYAFVRGRGWIRVPALVWSGTMMANVLIILMDERYGESPAPNFGLVLALNLPWLLMPAAMIWRMGREHPFTGPATEDGAGETAGARGGRRRSARSDRATARDRAPRAGPTGRPVAPTIGPGPAAQASAQASAQQSPAAPAPR